MKILFWNTHNNKNINHILSELIIENNISIAVLAEYEADISNLINSLFEPGLQDDHYSFQIIKKEYILCCVHLSSQIYTNSEGARNIEISKIVTDIQNLENDNSTENTIIVGDLNINPFDHGCMDANLFHSIPYYNVAKRKTRTIEKQSFQMFYNPMWNFLGDFNEPYGTYYYGGSRIDNSFWHIYDQVMIRPAIRKRFVDSSLRIVIETKSYRLINRLGHPDKNVSDHLPITFEIKEK